MSAPNLAFWTVRPGCGELRPAPLPPPGDGEVLVRNLYSAVSRGTESLVFRGEVPESEYERMRAPFQEGDFPGPLKYGYIGVGVVEDGVGGAAAALRGRKVFCLHPHQQRYVVPTGPSSPCPPACPPRARCWPPTSRPRSTLAGTERLPWAIASRWSAPGWSAAWSPGCARVSPASSSS